jgi:hypothetical protein
MAHSITFLTCMAINRSKSEARGKAGKTIGLHPSLWDELDHFREAIQIRCM